MTETAWPGRGVLKLPKVAALYCDGHAIPVAARRAAGLRYLNEDEATSLVGKLADDTRSDGLAFPFTGTNSGVVRFLKKDAKPKFKVPFGWEPQLYLAPLPQGCPTPERIKRDPKIALNWGEGPPKALPFAWLSKRPTIAAMGLDGWGNAASPSKDFADFAWQGREVVILVDSDAASKVSGQKSIRRLVEYLESLGARVLIRQIPCLPGTEKTDVNDMIVAKGIEELLKIEPLPIPAEWGADEATQELNQRLAFLLDNGRAEIITESDDPEYPGTRKIALAQVKDLRFEYANQQAKVGFDRNGYPIFKSKLEIWLADSYRRRARRVWFDPSLPWGLDPKTSDFNIYQGWAVVPLAPNGKRSWKRLHDHVYEVIANGNAAHGDYVLNWMAFNAQFPARLPEVAIVTYGGEGTGKGLVWKSYGRLYGRHYIQLDKKEQLVGKFNMHLQDKLFIFADESFFAGDNAAASALKGLITEPSMLVEPKFVNPYTLRSYRKLAIASNESWVIPADADARRYAVFQVSERRKGDHSYFAAMW